MYEVKQLKFEIFLKGESIFILNIPEYQNMIEGYYKGKPVYNPDFILNFIEECNPMLINKPYKIKLL